MTRRVPARAGPLELVQGMALDGVGAFALGVFAADAELLSGMLSGHGGAQGHEGVGADGGDGVVQSVGVEGVALLV